MGTTIIVPAKLPEPYLSTLVEDIHKTLHDIDHEILIQTEVGLTNAVIEGTKKSLHDTIVVMDADGSHSPSYLPIMVQLEQKYSLVIGSKVLGKDTTPFSRRLISKIYRWFARHLLDLKVSDPMSGFVAGNKSLFLTLKPSTDYKFLLQLLVHNPAPKVIEIPIVFRDRQEGESKVTLRTGLKTFSSILKLWWERK